MASIIPPPDLTVRTVIKRVTFTGAVSLGAVGAVPLFTVTEGALIRLIVAQVEETLTDVGDAATLALGVTGSTSLFIAATDTDTLQGALLWVDTAPDNPGVAVPAALKDIAINDSIKATVAGEAVTGGTLQVRVYWSPLTSGSNVVAA